MNRGNATKIVSLLLMILTVVMAAGNVQPTLAGNASAPSVGQNLPSGVVFQTANETNAHSASITVTLPKVPKQGDALVGAISLPTIGPIAPTVTGVVEGKAKWYRATAKMSASRDEDVELWYTLKVDHSPKLVNVTFELSNDFSIGTLAVVVEFTNIAGTNALQNTGSAQGDCASTCTIASGTTGKTSSPNELAIAFLGNNFMAASKSGQWNGSPSNGFKVLGTPFSKEGAEYDSKIVATLQKVTTSDTFVDSSPFDWCGVVATFLTFQTAS